MADELMEKIRDAEAAAEEIAAEAEREAAAAVAAAKAYAADKLETAEKDVAALLQAAGEENRHRTDEKIDAGRDGARAEAKRLIAAADGNRRAALDKIIQEIFEKWQ